MNQKTLAGLLAISLAVGFRVSAQSYDTNGEYVETFVGSGIPGFLNGQGQDTEFNNPSQIVADSSGNLFVYDSGNSAIRMVTPGGTVSTFLTLGTLAGPMAIDRSNNIWTVVQQQQTLTYLFNVYGTNGILSQNINVGNLWPAGVCFDSGNNLYFSVALGTGAYTIYRYSPSTGPQVFAGSGVRGEMDGNGIFTEFGGPGAMACDEANNIYVTDLDAATPLLRRIDQNQNVTTITNLVSTGADASVAAVDDNGNVICVSATDVAEVTARTNILLIAGPKSPYFNTGFTNGPGDLALFNDASGLCLSQGMIFVADSGNQRIRSISFNPVPQQVTGPNLGIATYAGVTITGFVGRTYQIQSSPDMTNWTTATTLLLTSTPYLWFDTSSVAGSKFYRAFLMP